MIATLDDGIKEIVVPETKEIEEVKVEVKDESFLEGLEDLLGL